MDVGVGPGYASRVGVGFRRGHWQKMIAKVSMQCMALAKSHAFPNNICTHGKGKRKQFDTFSI